MSEASTTPLKPEDIAVGTLIWYRGRTSHGEWDCPAIIYKVDEVFYIMSLDDMREQEQPYDVLADVFSPTSRTTMRVASIAEVDAYLANRGSKMRAAQIILKVQGLQHKIVVTRRSDDWHACLAGHPGVWDAGANALEAIGGLVTHHPECTGILIVQK